MIESKLTTEFKTTMFRPVRAALGLGPVGLPVPSLVRSTKIATIEARHADRLGLLPASVWAEVASDLRRHLGLQPTRR